MEETDADRVTKPQTKPKESPPARDPLFDALAKGCGSNPLEMTDSEKRACGVALAKIRKACPSLTVSEIERRVANFRRANRPDFNPTPPRIMASWSTLGAGAGGPAPRVGF